MQAKILQKFNALSKAKRNKIKEAWGGYKSESQRQAFDPGEDILGCLPRIRAGSDVNALKIIEKKKYDVLPETDKNGIKHALSLETHSTCPTLEDYLVSKLPEVGSDAEAVELRNWLGYSNRPIYWPFIWDLIRYDVSDDIYEKRRKVVAEHIVKQLSPRPATSLDFTAPENLVFGDFRNVDFSNTTPRNTILWDADFTNANLQGASFKKTILSTPTTRNADFTRVSHLRIDYLIDSKDLYQTKLPVEDINRQVEANECKPSDVTKLEDKIIVSYAKELSVQYAANQNDSAKLQTDVIEPLLKLVQFSGFSPLEWGRHDEAFQQKFDTLYRNHQKVLDSLKEKVNAIVPSRHDWKISAIEFDYWKRADGNANYNDWQTGSYSSNRLKTEYWKSVFKPAPSASRAYQIYRLQRIQFPDDDGLKNVVDTLLEVKREIEKERNIFDSELLKKINEVLVDGVNFDSPSANAASTATTPN